MITAEGCAERPAWKSALVASAVAYGRGDREGALSMLEEAARRGHPGAMVQAANIAGELGRVNVEQFWLETAAAAGSGQAMYNLGVLEFERGSRSAAATWLERAAAAGEDIGYAALVELAEQAEDVEGAKRWAEAGAKAGNPRCLGLHGMYLCREGPSHVQEGLHFLEAGASKGDPDAMLQAGITWNYQGNAAQSKYWIEQALKAGHPRARETLIKDGMG